MEQIKVITPKGFHILGLPEHLHITVVTNTLPDGLKEHIFNLTSDKPESKRGVKRFLKGIALNLGFVTGVIVYFVIKPIVLSPFNLFKYLFK